KPLKNEDLTRLFKDIVRFTQKKTKSLLLIEDNELDSSGIVKMLQNNDVKITIAETGKEATKLLQSKSYDCVVLDYMLPDMSGMELMKKVNATNQQPIKPLIVYSAKDFTTKEAGQLKQLAKNVILKDVKSLDLLLEEMVAQLHIDHKNLQPAQRRLIEGM